MYICICIPSTNPHSPVPHGTGAAPKPAASPSHSPPLEAGKEHGTLGTPTAYFPQPTTQSSNPEPWIPNPNPDALSPQPSLLIPEPSTPSPSWEVGPNPSSTLIPGPFSLHLQISFPNPQLRTLSCEPKNLHPTFTQKVGSEFSPNTEARYPNPNPRPSFLHPNTRPATLHPGHVKPGEGGIQAVPVNPEALFALFMDPTGVDPEEHAKRVEGELFRGCETMARRSAGGLGATTWSHGDGVSSEWTVHNKEWFCVDAPALPVYRVDDDGPITAETTARLSCNRSDVKWLVPAADCDISSPDAELHDSTMMALLQVVQRLLGSDAVIADSLLMGKLMETFVLSLPRHKKQDWSHSFDLDQVGVEAFEHTALSATCVQPLHAADILKRKYVVLPFHVPGDPDGLTLTGLKKLYGHMSENPGSKHYTFFVVILPSAEDTNDFKVKVLCVDTKPGFTGRFKDVATAAIREWLHAVGGCFEVKKWQRASVVFEDFPVPVQPGSTECGLMVVQHVALFLMGASLQQRSTFSTEERVKTLRHNALCVLMGSANVKFSKLAAGGKRAIKKAKRFVEGS